MGLFSSNFNRPGPGVPHDAPRATGFKRVWEVLSRDTGSFLKANFLLFLSSLPGLLGISFAVATHSLIPAVLAGVLGGLMAAPCLCGLVDTVLRALRDEPGYWWVTYKRAWHNNTRGALLPGAICGLVFGLLVFECFHLNVIASGWLDILLFLLGVMLAIALFTLLWPQMVLVELPLFSVARNVLMLFLGNLPRALGAMAVQLVYWGAFLLYFPLTPILLPVTGYWLPVFLSLFILYRPIEKAFHLEEQLQEKRAREEEEAKTTSTV